MQNSMLVIVSAIEKNSIDSARCVCLSDITAINENLDVIILSFINSTALKTALEIIYKADITPRLITNNNVVFKKENIIAILV